MFLLRLEWRRSLLAQLLNESDLLPSKYGIKYTHSHITQVVNHTSLIGGEPSPCLEEITHQNCRGITLMLGYAFIPYLATVGDPLVLIPKLLVDGASG